MFAVVVGGEPVVERRSSVEGKLLGVRTRCQARRIGAPVRVHCIRRNSRRLEIACEALSFKTQGAVSGPGERRGACEAIKGGEGASALVSMRRSPAMQTAR